MCGERGGEGRRASDISGGHAGLDRGGSYYYGVVANQTGVRSGWVEVGLGGGWVVDIPLGVDIVACWHPP